MPLPVAARLFPVLQALARRVPGLLAGLLLAAPAGAQVVSFADKSLGVGLGHTHLRHVWLTGYDYPACTDGVSISLFYDFTSAENGLSVTPFFNAGQLRNGLTLSLLGCEADTLRGVGLASFVMGSHLSGVLVGLAEVGRHSLGSTGDCRQLSGLAISFLLVRAQALDGLAVAGCVRSRRQRGVSVALLNRCQQLHGLQLGLLNYAGNNPPGLRWLPVLNLHR